MMTLRVLTRALLLGILLTKDIFAEKDEFSSSDEKNAFPIDPEPRIQNVNFDKARQSVQFVDSLNSFNRPSQVSKTTGQFVQISRETNTKNSQENRKIFTKLSKNGQSPGFVSHDTFSAPRNQPSFVQHIPISDLNSNFQQNTDIQIQKPEEMLDIRNLSSPFHPTVENNGELDDQNSNSDNARPSASENIGILDGSQLSTLVNKKFENIVTNLTTDGYLTENADQKLLKNLSDSFIKYLERYLHPNSIDQDRITDQEEQILDDTSRQVIEKFKKQHRPISSSADIDGQHPHKKISTNKNDRKFQTPPTLRLPLMQKSEERLPVRPVILSGADHEEEPLGTNSKIEGVVNVGQSRVAPTPDGTSSVESGSESSNAGGFTVRPLLPLNVRPAPTDDEDPEPTQGPFQIAPFGNLNRVSNALTIIQPRIPIPLDRERESQPPETDQPSSVVDSSATSSASVSLPNLTREPIASPPGFLPPLVDHSASVPTDSSDVSFRRSSFDFTTNPTDATPIVQIGSGFELATSSPAFPTPPDWTAFKEASSSGEEQNVTSSGTEEEGSSPFSPISEASSPETAGEGSSGAVVSGSTPTGSEESGESESPSSESESTSLIPGGHLFHNISEESSAVLENTTVSERSLLTGSAETESQESEENSTTVGYTGAGNATESLTTVSQSLNETSTAAISTTTAENEVNETSVVLGLVVVTSVPSTQETTESNGTQESGGSTSEGVLSSASPEINETTTEYNATVAATTGSMLENQTITSEPAMVNATGGEGPGQENATSTPGGRPIQGTAAWRLRLTDVAWDSSLNDKMSWQYRKLYDNVYPDLKEMFTDILKDNYAGTTIERFSAGSVIVSGKTESYDKVDNAQFGDNLDKLLKNRNYKLGSHDVDPDTINVDLPGGSSPQVAPKSSTAGMPGYVIAIIVAAVAVLGIILIGAYFIRRRRNRQRQNTYMVDEETMNGAAKALQNVQPQQRPLGASRNGAGGGGSNPGRTEQMASINMYEMKDHPSTGAPGAQAAQTGQSHTNFGYQGDGVSSDRAQNGRNGSSDKKKFQDVDLNK